MEPNTLKLILSCEHAVNTVPPGYRVLLEGAGSRLRGHEAYDMGALDLAVYLSRYFHVPLFRGSATRLLVDLNRSLHHPRLFSRWTAILEPSRRRWVLDTYYHPFRAQVLQALLAARRRRSTVLHLSVHSFTPVAGGVKRRAGIGILYDPSRSGEKKLARCWRASLKEALPATCLRLNYPYRGVADGHTAALRKRFTDSRYLGLELEINQELVRARSWKALQKNIAVALADALNAMA